MRLKLIFCLLTSFLCIVFNVHEVVADFCILLRVIHESHLMIFFYFLSRFDICFLAAYQSVIIFYKNNAQ